MKIRNKFIIIMFIVLVSLACFNLKSSSVFAISTEVEGIENFPDSYKGYLNVLHTLYPNWKFSALNTGLNWSDVILNEDGVTLKNAVPTTYADMWKYIPITSVEAESGYWVSASTNAIKYAIDPRNYLNKTDIFQFEKTNYRSDYQIKAGVESILNGTNMYNKKVSYVDTNNITIDLDKTYSDLIIEAGSTYGVNPYHLAARIKQETGGDIYNNTSISGKTAGYIGVYNFFNIGAGQGVLSGLQHAKDLGWNSPKISIDEGAKFIYRNYIYYGQNTIYLEKFDVNLTATAVSIYQWQYMSNIFAPKNEAYSLYTAYNSISSDVMQEPFEFLIPVYNYRPDIAVGYDDVLGFNKVNESVVVNSTPYSILNIRSGPFVDSTIITTANNNDVITRISVSNNSSILYDKVKLSNGIVGYAIHDALIVKVQSMNLNKSSINFDYANQTTKLSANINPYNATNQKVIWSSSDTSVATVLQDGTVTSVGQGTAVITAKSEEDQNKIAICNVTVQIYPPDIEGHWGQSIIEKWIDRGMTAGHSITKLYYPDQYILKSDLMYTINRLMQYTDKVVDISCISDVNAIDWYYTDVQKAIKAGYVYPMSGTNIYPNATVTREEFMVMMCRALKLPDANLNVLDKYVDSYKISSNIKQEVANYIGAFGFSGNTINGQLCLIPQNPLTKADTFYFIDKAFDTYDNPPVVNNVPNDTINHWSKNIVESLIDRGITASHNITKCFYPDQYILKVDLIYTLNRMMKFTYLATSDEMSKYTDVNTNNWYYTDVQKAVKAGYIYPLGNSNIYPNGTVSREELFVMISRALNLPNVNLSVLDKYTDSYKISSNIRQEVANYIGAFGFGGNTVNGQICLIPQNILTKADLMFFIYNALPQEKITVLNTVKSLGVGNTLDIQATISQNGLTGETNPQLSIKIGNGSEVLVTATNRVDKVLTYSYTIPTGATGYISYKLVGGNLKGMGNLDIAYSKYYLCDLFKVN